MKLEDVHLQLRALRVSRAGLERAQRKFLNGGV